MAGRLSSIVSHFRALFMLRRAKQELERNFRDRGMIRKISVVPGLLVLECIGPVNPRTATITGTNPTTGEVTVIKSTSTTSEWSGKALFPFWGQSIEIHIHANGDRPGDSQLAAVKSLLHFTDCIRNDIQQRVYDYYTAKVLPTNPKDESGEPLPFIDSPDEIGAVVFLRPSIQLDQSADALLTFTMQFATRWNYYSIDVQLKDWKITFVG